jgi:hypothetical protein
MDLVYATEALAARGVEPTADPRTPGEIIHFVLAVKQRKEFRPAGWEKRCADWARQESSYVREVVLFNAPRPLPESLLGFYQIGVRTLIATTRQGSVFHDAAQCALDMKIPKDEVLGMLADRLDSKEGYADLKMCLLDLLEGDMNDHLCAAGAPFPGEEKAAAVKAAWKRFLKEHAQSIREGELFDLDDTEIMREMLR